MNDRLGSGPAPAGSALRAVLTAVLGLLVAASPLSAALTHSRPVPEEPPRRRAASKCWRPLRLPVSARPGRLAAVIEEGDTPWILGIASAAHDGGPIALRQRRGGWQATTVPYRGVSGLVGGDSEPGGATWAVGFVRPGASMRPVSARWVDDRWVDMPVPDPPGLGAALADAEVLPSGEVWAVGTRLQAGRTRAFALQWRGRWERDEPRLNARESGLAAITSTPDGTVWAVGWRLVRGVPKPLALRRSSSGWDESDTSGISDGQAVLTGVDFRSGSEGYASGYDVPADGATYVPLLLRWDGTSWARLDLPWAGSTSAVIHSVAAGDDDLLLTGALVADDSGWTRAFQARLAGARWEMLRTDINPFNNSELLDGGFVGSRPVVVGGHANSTMAFRGCLKLETWTRDPAPEGEAGSEDPPEPKARPLGASPARQRLARPGPARAVRFVDVARRTGLHEVGPTWGGLTADFNGDEWPDIFYTRHNTRPPRLAVGGPNGFRTIHRSLFRRPHRDRHGCAAADVDGDEWTDLFCVAGADRGSKMKSNELWLRAGTSRPRSVAADYGVVDPFGRGRTATFFDLDGDPHPDLYVTNEPERIDAMPGMNRLYRSDGGKRYLAAPELGLDHSIGGVCATSGDIDSDGDDDLLVCATQAWAGLPTGLRIFRNDEGRLVPATRDLGVRPIADQDAVLADFDGDGRADDVAQLGTGTLRVSLGSGGRMRQAFQMAVSLGTALGAGDADGDGRADLYVVRGGSGNQPDLMLLNSGSGRAFRSVTIPQARTGTADDVVVLDHDLNGYDDFLVLNGRDYVGPVQLIASYPRR